MADQLFLSYNLRGYTGSNMLRHYEKMLRKFPFSKLVKGGPVLRIVAVRNSEAPLLEKAFEPGTIDGLMEAAREYETSDAAVQVDAAWDLWQYDGDWQLTPARVTLLCYGPGFEDSDGDHLRIDLGIDTRFLPQPELANHAAMVRSNIKSLLHLVSDLDSELTVEGRRLWTESGENFAKRLQSALD